MKVGDEIKYGKRTSSGLKIRVAKITKIVDEKIYLDTAAVLYMADKVQSQEEIDGHGAWMPLTESKIINKLKQIIREEIKEEIRNISLTEADDITVDNVKYKVYFKRTSKTSHDIIIKQGSKVSFTIIDGVTWHEGRQQYRNSGMNYYPNFLAMGTGQGNYYRTVPATGPFLDYKKRQYLLECIQMMQKHNLTEIDAEDIRYFKYKE